MTNDRRSVALALLVAVALLAGCSGIPFLGGSCGPGSNAIGDISGNVSDAEIRGTIESINETQLVVDDGTGSVAVTTVGGFNTSTAATGDCATVRGQAFARNDSTDHDAVVLAENATVRS